MEYRKQSYGAGAVFAGLLLLLAGCTTLPERVETLEQARSAVSSLQRNPLAREIAPVRFDNAQQALTSAQNAYADKEPLEVVEYHAHVALRNAQIAQLEIDEQRERAVLESAEAEIDRLLLRQQQEAALLRQLQPDDTRRRNQELSLR